MSVMKRLLGSLVAAMMLVMAVAIVSPTSAWADDVAFDEPDRNEFMLTPRLRAVTVPDFILGAWFDEHASHWDGQSNFAYGLDFVWRKVGDFEISTAVEYADLSMPDAFWQEKGDPASGAELTQVDMQFLSLTASGYWYWDVEPWFAPYVGGGLGVGTVLGDIVTYEPKEGSDCRAGLGGSSSFAPSSCFNNEGEPNYDEFKTDGVEEDIPPVLPVLNVTGGARFNFADYGVAKVEVGFHNYLFAGMSVGGQW